MNIERVFITDHSNDYRMTGWKTDAQVLSEQYADASTVNARAALHEKFRTNEVDLPEWIFQHVNSPPTSRILTLGCGDGDFWKAVTEAIPRTWHLALTDFSSGMVREARHNLSESEPMVTFARVDATSIPFSDETFEAVTANHMLYHVPHREKALQEIARVLQSRGKLYATTNGEGHMGELLDLVRASTGVQVEGASEFTLENGEDQLHHAFDTVDCHHYADSLRVTEIEPLIAYALSRPEFTEEHLDRFVELVHDEIQDGTFEITKNTGLFVATNST